MRFARSALSLASFAASIATLATPSNAPAESGFADRAALVAFVYCVVEANRYNAYLAGVTLSIVKDGKIVLLKGYGLAGVDPERPVDPERSLFRIGSISKTFVWTALMQLEAQGRLSLDDPVNDHLPDDLEIPDDGFEEPIRVRHLMTHTPGFEDAALGHLIVRDEQKLWPLNDYLGRFRPRRVRPPGDFMAYSNYGAALAGAVVANVSGVEFETYVEENIFAPLGMSHSTFREPYGDAAPAGLPERMSEELERHVAQGLEWSEGAWQAQDYEFIVQQGPAGSMSSTALDMARYMLAHLNEGELDGARILDPKSAKRMHQLSFSNAEGMPGNAHGFWQYDLPGRPDSFGHDGATLHFLSNMVMVPELDLGVFVSANSSAGMDAYPFVNSLPHVIVGRYLGRDTPTFEPPADFSERAEQYVGSYRTTRRSYTQLEKIISLGAVTDVSATDDGHLLTTDAFATTRWVEVGPHLFREIEGEQFIAFREGGEGRITHLFHSYDTSERIGFFEGIAWLGLILFLGVHAAIGMMTGAWLRRGRVVEQSPLEKRADQLMGLLGALWLAFFAAVGVAVAGIVADDSTLLYEFPTPALSMTLTLLLICAPLTFVALASLIPVWRRGSWPVWRRIRHSLAALILTALVLPLNDWNLLGFKDF
jgi:CubicO group peptidase (beta-lactamase class C family)